MNNNSKNECWGFSVEESTIVKGCALLLMIIHHSFPWKDRLIADIHYSELFSHFCMWSKICVPVFAFISGWAFYLAKDKSFTNAFKKSGLFLVYYWICAIPCILFALFFCDYHPIGFGALLNELLPVRHPTVMLHCWYVSFFIILQLSLPLYEQLNRLRSRILRFILSVAIPLFVGYIPQSDIFPLWFDIRMFLPSAYCGYLFAYYHLFDKIRNILSSLDSKFQVFLFICILCGCIPLYGGSSFVISHLGYPSSPFYMIYGILAAIFIYSLVELVRVIPFRSLRSGMLLLGVHSMNIWFLHSLFTSSATRAVFQPYLYYYITPLFVIASCVLTCLPFSYALIKLQSIVKHYYLLLWLRCTHP